MYFYRSSKETGKARKTRTIEPISRGQEKFTSSLSTAIRVRVGNERGTILVLPHSEAMAEQDITRYELT